MVTYQLLGRKQQWKQKLLKFPTRYRTVYQISTRLCKSVRVHKTLHCFLCTCHRLPLGGGADVEKYGDFMRNLQQIWAIGVGEMWRLRFMMTRLSGKMWGLCHWWTERTLEQVVFSFNQRQDGGGQEEYVLKSIVFCLWNRPSVKYLYAAYILLYILLLEVIVGGQQVLITSSSLIFADTSTFVISRDRFRAACK